MRRLGGRRGLERGRRVLDEGGAINERAEAARQGESAERRGEAWTVAVPRERMVGRNGGRL